MKIYHYKQDTKEFLHEGIADVSPLEPGSFLVPAFATDVAPPSSIPPGKCAVFNGESWDILTDKRKTIIWRKDNSEPSMMVELGDIPDDMTDKPRPTDYHFWGVAGWELNVTLWLNGEIRPKRNALLNDVDLKYCNAEKWSDMTAAKKAEWKSYKQALKDLPETIDPNNPVWPVMPS